MDFVFLVVLILFQDNFSLMPNPMKTQNQGRDSTKALFLPP